MRSQRAPIYRGFLFARITESRIVDPPTAPTVFAKRLSESPAEWGRVIFENIQASVPSLGLVAIAMTWVEIARFLS